jgi:hypothetical protein
MHKKSLIKVYQIIKDLNPMEQNTKETFAYLKVNITMFFSWGGTNFSNFKDLAFGFKANGRYHQFWVLITLNSLDLFDVTLLNEDYTVKCRVENLYFDVLAEAIDELIETNPKAIKQAMGE